jgi:hypothetical protein
MFYGIALTSVLVAGSLSAAPAPAPAAVRGELLPGPAGGQISARAVDVSPLGVVGGNTLETITGPDGTTSSVELPQRWIPAPGSGWLRQQLTLPAGVTSGSVAGLTDAGEAAGSVMRVSAHAARWPITGRSTTQLSDSPSTVTAVGPNGPWGVSTFDPDNPLQGEAELVNRAGVSTPLRGTPDLDTGIRRSVGSVGGPGTAVAWVHSGFGRGATAQAVLWRNGATLRFPVVSSYTLGPACTSRVQADGSTVYSGFGHENGVFALVLVRHVGGVPGTDVVLTRATAADQPRGSLVCTPGAAINTLASDGGVAGYLIHGGEHRAAHWDAANTMTSAPLDDGEVFAAGVAAASGNRMVISARHEDGTNRLSLWDDGVRTPLTAPRGWNVTPLSVIELTDAGLLVANVQNAAGVVRPAAWRLGRSPR